MKKLLLFIVVCGWLFALLDWKVVQYTRLQNRQWLDWMHAHETQYALVTRTVELIVCAPAMALKPIFYDVDVRVYASDEEQKSIVHAPLADLSGFYHLPKRGESWTFVPWYAWFLYWTPLSVLWWQVAKRIYGTF